MNITNNEIVQNSKSEPKKISILCTFKDLMLFCSMCHSNIRSLGKYQVYWRQCHEIFDFRSFPHESSYSQAPIITLPLFKLGMNCYPIVFKQNMKNIQFKHFFHLPTVLLTPVCGAPSVVNIFANLWKYLNCCWQDAWFWRKMIHEKNLKSKNLWHCAFNIIFVICYAL